MSDGWKSIMFGSQKYLSRKCRNAREVCSAAHSRESLGDQGTEIYCYYKMNPMFKHSLAQTYTREYQSVRIFRSRRDGLESHDRLLLRIAANAFTLSSNPSVQGEY